MRSTINLYEGDCRPAMRKMADNQYSLAIVDPPYGIGEDGSRNKADRPTKKWKNPVSQEYKTFDDSEIPSQEYFVELFRISKNQIIWGANHFVQYLPNSSGWIVWNKKANIKEYLSMAELAFSSFQIKCNMYDFLWAGFKKAVQETRFHPTQKPVALYKWLLKNYAKPGDTILDTHFGSLSIGVACWDAGYSLDAYEIDHDYFEAGKKRLENHTAQLQISYE